MKWKLFFAILAACGLIVAGISQSSDDKAKKSDEILTKVRELDIYNQVLPLMMTKDQLNKILPALEKARQQVRNTEAKEYEQLVKLEPDLNAALKDARTSGKVPSREMLNKTLATFKGLGLIRMQVADTNAQEVLKVMKEVLNDGQIKAATNALNPASVDPSLDPKTMSEDQKLAFYVKFILLDPLAYNVLRDMAKA